MKNLLLLLGLILCLSARLTRSALSARMKASRAALSFPRFSITISVEYSDSNAGGLELRVVGTEGFCPKTSCAGEKPWTLSSEFFACNAQHKAVSISL